MTFGDDANRSADRWHRMFSAGAAEPDEWRPDVPAILSAGRAAARRRRVLVVAAAVGGAAIVGSGAAAIPAFVPSGSGPQIAADGSASPQPAPPTPAPAATTPTPENLTSGWQEVMEPIEPSDALDRCRATLAQGADDIDPGSWEFDDRPLGVLPPEEYYVGDHVALASGNASAECLVPGSWEPAEAVDPEQPAPEPVDHAAILAACSATISADLREWEVRAADADGVGGLAAVLTSPEPDPHVARCDLQPASWQDGIGPATHVFRSRPLSGLLSNAANEPISWHVAVDAYHSCIKASPMPCHGGVYAGAGVVPPDVATLEFALPGEVTVTVPVTDGLFAFRAVDGVTDRGLSSVWVSAYDADGELLERFDTLWPGG